MVGHLSGCWKCDWFVGVETLDWVQKRQWEDVLAEAFGDRWYEGAKLKSWGKQVDCFVNKAYSTVGLARRPELACKTPGEE